MRILAQIVDLLLSLCLARIARLAQGGEDMDITHKVTCQRLDQQIQKE